MRTKILGLEDDIEKKHRNESGPSTYTRKLMTESVRMLDHFTMPDQFIGLFGSSVSGSVHQTTSSDGQAGSVGEGAMLNGHICNKVLLRLQVTLWTTNEEKSVALLVKMGLEHT